MSEASVFERSRPLPYIVVLLEIVSDDEPPIEHIVRIPVAYSLFEAVMQASVQLTGHYDVKETTKYRLTNAMPDLPAYIELEYQLALLTQASLASRKGV